MSSILKYIKSFNNINNYLKKLLKYNNNYNQNDFSRYNISKVKFYKNRLIVLLIP